MNDIKFMQADKGESVFALEENGERIAEMVVGISGKEMSVYHTEVAKRNCLNFTNSQCLPG